MNVLDIIFLGLIVIFTLLSMMRGALKEALSLLGLLGGFFCANWFYLDLAGNLESLLPDRTLAELISYVAILLVGYFLGIFLTGLSDLFSSRRNDLLNRLGGGAIGFCKGTTFSMVLFWIINAHIPPFQDELAGSFMAEEIARLFSFMESLSII